MNTFEQHSSRMGAIKFQVMRSSDDNIRCWRPAGPSLRYGRSPLEMVHRTISFARDEPQRILRKRMDGVNMLGRHRDVVMLTAPPPDAVAKDEICFAEP
jgi:hypothetical protein